MKKVLFLGLIAIVFGLSSCQVGQVTMERAIPEIELRAYDLDISDQKSATITVTRVFGIDFSRLFNKQSARFESASASPIAVVGALLESPDKSYAIRALIDENQGTDYDMVLYPKFVINRKSFIVFSQTEVKVVSRFASVKSE